MMGCTTAPDVLEPLRAVFHAKVSPGGGAPPAPIPGLSQLQKSISISVMVEQLLHLAMESIGEYQSSSLQQLGAVPQRHGVELVMLLKGLATRTQALQELLEGVAGQTLRDVHASLGSSYPHDQQHAPHPSPSAGDIAKLLAVGNIFVQRVGAMLIAHAHLQLMQWLEHYLSSALMEYSTALEQYAADVFAMDADGDEDGTMDDDAQPATAPTSLPPEQLQALIQGPWGSQLGIVSRALCALGLQEHSEAAAGRALSRHLHQRLAAHTSKVFYKQVLPEALAYAENLAMAFLPLVVPSGGPNTLAAWQQRLDFYVYYTVGMLRITDMFDILLDFPDSAPAVEDLKTCLQQTSLAATCVRVFGGDVQRRLLHVGAMTGDILQAYTSTIKVLRCIDPTDVLLGAIGAPIKEYLRSRRDTIRCIVTLLTDDDAGEEGEGGPEGGLLEELRVAPPDPPMDAAEEANIDSDKQLWQAIEGWEPAPIDSNPDQPRGRQADIIGNLVDIYGSQELFINEYRSMLADKLLSKVDFYNVERELHTLELLKLRFGESNLHTADIMLKDVIDSKRLNTMIQNLPNTATPTKANKHRPLVDTQCLSATVVSHLFWPSLSNDDDLIVPSHVQEMLDTYAAKYHSTKLPRKLIWKKTLGTVSLDVTVGNTMLSMDVTPVQATLLCAFTNQSTWALNDLAAHVGMPAQETRRRVLFWVNQGVIVEARGEDGGWIYTRAEQMAEGGARAAGNMDEDMHDDDGGSSNVDNTVLSMGPFETYIMGMLTNFDALPLDRIHNMLKMFAVQPPYDKSMEELAGYLARLVAEEKLVLEGGMYKKSASP